MMWPNRITINTIEYNREELAKVCHSKIHDLHCEEWERKIYAFLDELNNDSSTVEVHSSGSTGSPKAFTVLKSQMISSAQMTGKYFQLSSGKTALLCLPVDYIAGKMMIVRAWVLGLNLITIKPGSDPLACINLIDFAALVPLQLQTLVDVYGKAGMERFQTIIVGGSDINPVLISKVQFVSTEVVATYGMTETLSHVALRHLNGNKVSEYYQTLDGVSIDLDERECLVVYAPHVNPNRLITNDIVKIHEQDKFTWLGRCDNVINSGGIKVIPEQLESKLKELFLDNRFFISSIPHNILGQQIILVIESVKPDADQLVTLKSSIKKLLNRYEIPKYIYFVRAFQETFSGKIQRQLYNATIENF
ncbi:MAG: AMP-binding protein [Desulfobacterales bacterium]|nr:AMP-binding protein [Desulfobacterales bacterium]